MAFVTAANNIGFSDTSAFIGVDAGLMVCAALPVGLTINGRNVDDLVKPKLERFMKASQHTFLNIVGDPHDGIHEPKHNNFCITIEEVNIKEDPGTANHAVWNWT